MMMVRPTPVSVVAEVVRTRGGHHRCPVSAALALLAPTLQRPEPCLLDSAPHRTQRVDTEVQSEVLVEAVEHFRQVRLLSSDGLVAVRLGPRGHLAHKALARFHARCATDGYRA